jgi:hypothetical protein
MSVLDFILNPPGGLSLVEILAIAFILGILHGITPDEHTWPITFSYAIGSYSTKGGAKAGFTFSLGFTAQRAILTTLGFVGLAAIYLKYNLDGPVYIVVGFVMFIAGAYILKGYHLHLPLDWLMGGREHHTPRSERLQPHEEAMKPIPVRMALTHGFIAGWGFGAFASIVTFILAPQVPSIWDAPLVGVFFGLGTMAMQITIGALFANLARMGRLTTDQVKCIGQKTAANTLYYGGVAFAAIGGAIIALPALDNVAISTGNPVPNLNSLGIAFFLVVIVVGLIGGFSFYHAWRNACRVPDLDRTLEK